MMHYAIPGGSSSYVQALLEDSSHTIWVGTDDAGNYYYAYAYSGSTYVRKAQGEDVCSWTLAEDKASAAVSAEGFNMLYVGSYASDNSTWRGYASVFSSNSILKDLVKPSEGGGGLDPSVTLNKRTDWKFSFYSGWARVTAMAAGNVYCFQIVPNSDELDTEAGLRAVLGTYQDGLKANGTAGEVIDGYYTDASPRYKMFRTEASNNYGYLGYENEFWNGVKSDANRYAGILMGVDPSTLTLTGDYYLDRFNDTDGNLK